MAAAAAPLEHVAGADRRVVSHRRVGGRHLRDRIAVTAWALSSLILRTTGSTSGALAAAVLIVGNPNVLYLQSTPMTEPLLFATTAAAVALTAAWIDSGAAALAGERGRRAGGRVPHALRSLADRGGDDRDRRSGGAAPRRDRAGCAPRRRQARRVAGGGRPAVPDQQPVDRRRLVRQRRLLRAREHRGAGPSAGGVAAGARGSLPALRLGAGLAGVRGGRARRLRVRAVQIARLPGAGPRAGRRRGAPLLRLPAGPSVSDSLRRAAGRRVRRADRSGDRPAVVARPAVCGGDRRGGGAVPGASARSHRAAHRRITARRGQHGGTPRRHRLPRRALRRRGPS